MEYSEDIQNKKKIKYFQRIKNQRRVTINTILLRSFLEIIKIKVFKTQYTGMKRAKEMEADKPYWSTMALKYFHKGSSIGDRQQPAVNNSPYIIID